MREVGGYIAGGMEGEEESTTAVLKWERVREEPTDVLKRISRLNEADWEREPAAALTFDKGCPSLVIILVLPCSKIGMQDTHFDRAVRF